MKLQKPYISVSTKTGGPLLSFFSFFCFILFIAIATVVSKLFSCLSDSQVKLYNEKRSDLEEQQLHLNVGLQKIRETVDQVEELQGSLSIKKNELEQKNTLANQKLKQMVKDQQEAEKKKVTSQEIHEILLVQKKDVSKKKEIVLRDLSKVEPAVKDAQLGVWLPLSSPPLSLSTPPLSLSPSPHPSHSPPLSLSPSPPTNFSNLVKPCLLSLK